MDKANSLVGSEAPSAPTTYLARLMAEPRMLVTCLAKEVGVDPATATRWVLVGIKGRATSGCSGRRSNSKAIGSEGGSTRVAPLSSGSWRHRIVT